MSTTSLLPASLVSEAPTSKGLGRQPPNTLGNAMKMMKNCALAALLAASLFAAFAAQAWARDTTPPVITPTVTGNQGSNGWYIGNVSVTWTVTQSTGTRRRGCGSVTQ